MVSIRLFQTTETQLEHTHREKDINCENSHITYAFAQMVVVVKSTTALNNYHIDAGMGCEWNYLVFNCYFMCLT